MSERTLRHWVQQADAGGDAPRRPGRPPHDGQALWRALLATARELRRQGRNAGAESIHRGLQGRIPLRLVREATSRLARRRRVREARHRKASRTTVHVLAKDVLWSLDAGHLGRDEHAVAVQGQVLRDVGSPRVLGATVGPPVLPEEVIALLEAVKRDRGTLPLALATDNGSSYTAASVVEYLENEGVLHLLNLPRTPQHNAWSEQGIGELKADAQLGRGVKIGIEKAAVLLEASWRRLDECRVRRTRDWRTMKECDEATPSWYDRSTMPRRAVYEAAQAAIAKAVAGVRSARAKRKARREAILPDARVSSGHRENRRR